MRAISETDMRELNTRIGCLTLDGAAYAVRYAMDSAWLRDRDDRGAAPVDMLDAPVTSAVQALRAMRVGA